MRGPDSEERLARMERELQRLVYMVEKLYVTRYHTPPPNTKDEYWKAMLR